MKNEKKIENEDLCLLVAMDNGLKNLKIICGEEKIIYQNKMTENHTQIRGSNTYNATYGKEKFTVGENAYMGDYNEGKADKCHIINALVGVTHFIKEDNEKVILLYGESVNKYYSDEHIDKLKQKLEGKHTIIVDDKSFTFIIEKVVVLPEGCGYLLNDLEKNQGIKYVIDIGGTTMNFITAKNCVPIAEKSFSSKLGMNSLNEKIRSSLIRNGHDCDLHEDEITELIKNNYLDKKGQEVVENTINERLIEIDRAISKNGFDIKAQLKMKEDSIEFVGGGSTDIKPYIESYFKTNEGVMANVVEDAVWANVKGFYEYGRILFKDSIK